MTHQPLYLCHHWLIVCKKLIFAFIKYSLHIWLLPSEKSPSGTAGFKVSTKDKVLIISTFAKTNHFFWIVDTKLVHKNLYVLAITSFLKNTSYFFFDFTSLMHWTSIYKLEMQKLNLFVFLFMSKITSSIIETVSSLFIL